MKSITELKEFYEIELLPDLKKLENIRKAQVIRQAYIFVTLAFSILLATILTLPTMLLVFMAVFLVVYFLIFGFKRKRFDYKNSYKESVLKKISTFSFPDAEYTPFQFIPKKYYDLCKLFIPKPDIYNGEDLIKGNADGINFQLSEIETMERKVDSDNKVFFVTQFKGLFFIAELQRKLENSTYIFGNTSTEFIAGFNSHYHDINILRPELIITGDDAFDKSFAVYSTDNYAAEKFLTTAFKKIIQEFKINTGANIQFAFIENYLYLAIPERKDLFKASMYKTLLKFNNIEQHYNELCFCIAVAKEFQKNAAIRTNA
ncbi:MAG: DUF3137 domain-containing protein [Bacteroidetes bacterium]|nr:DUF3137 domain-containing protein [Bacteroidota bacterium]MBP7399525.1 DUF3137 domain-containing protein [Chitinophagales bacterium]MBK7108003.1 DUF3137 domain-containing protein [Bacteroidota bacterium]MBK8486564.1 DUF3137 domain-containing protein [Bacteroidota bacterium]MBK8683346.1 DUF3137 domain-containing protein [Bacteroidota bacterium]